MDLLTAQELAGELRLTVDTIWRYTRMGRIPVIRISPKDYRYHLPDVLAALVHAPSQPVTAPAPVEEPMKPVDLDQLRRYIGRLKASQP